MFLYKLLLTMSGELNVSVQSVFFLLSVSNAQILKLIQRQKVDPNEGVAFRNHFVAVSKG